MHHTTSPQGRFRRTVGVWAEVGGWAGGQDAVIGDRIYHQSRIKHELLFDQASLAVCMSIGIVKYNRANRPFVPKQNAFQVHPKRPDPRTSAGLSMSTQETLRRAPNDDFPTLLTNSRASCHLVVFRFSVTRQTGWVLLGEVGCWGQTREHQSRLAQKRLLGAHQHVPFLPSTLILTGSLVSSAFVSRSQPAAVNAAKSTRFCSSDT